MSDLLIAPAYAEIAALKRHFQLLNGSPEALQYLLASTPTPTGAQLETWLVTPANLTAFQQLISSPAGAAAVAASSTAMAAVLDSSTARIAVYGSDTAWNAIITSPTGKAALLAKSRMHNTKSTTHIYPTNSGNGVCAVLLQQGSDNANNSYAGANADTYSINSTTYIDRYVRVTGLTHRSSNSDYSSYIKYIIMQ